MRNYYTTGQAAQLLGVCVRTVQLWVENGQIDSWKTSGGHRRLSKESVNALRDADSSSAEATADTCKSPRILLVEDSKSDARLLRQFVLTACPEAEVSEAADGYEALIALGRQAPDILITDLQMPNMDGFQMLAAIQQQLGDEKPAILITTAYSEAEMKQLPPVPDFVSAVLFKPLDLNQFSQQLRAVISHSGK